MIDNEIIGVGITTRNGTEKLRLSLKHFSEYTSIVDRFVVIDDNSPPDVYEEIKALVEASGMPIELVHATKRLGITGAKNACLHRLRDYDHIFLFDDDAWPIQYGWETYWIAVMKENQIGHSMWLTDLTHINSWSFINTIDTSESISYYNNCLGVLLYFSKACVETIGGYDSRARNVYGYEHAQISNRAHKAGFTGKHPYVSPSRCKDYIFSVDISYKWLGEQTPLDTIDLSRFASSVTPEEAAGHTHNSVIMGFTDIQIPLIDPIGEHHG